MYYFPFSSTFSLFYFFQEIVPTNVELISLFFSIRNKSHEKLRLSGWHFLTCTRRQKSIGIHGVMDYGVSRFFHRSYEKSDDTKSSVSHLNEGSENTGKTLLWLTVSGQNLPLHFLLSKYYQYRVNDIKKKFRKIGQNKFMWKMK